MKVLTLEQNRKALALRTANLQLLEQLQRRQRMDSPSYFDWQLRQQRRAMARKVGK